MKQATCESDLQMTYFTRQFYISYHDSYTMNYYHASLVLLVQHDLMLQ